MRLVRGPFRQPRGPLALRAASGRRVARRTGAALRVRQSAARADRRPGVQPCRQHHGRRLRAARGCAVGRAGVISVEVVYALPEVQSIYRVHVAEHATVSRRPSMQARCAQTIRIWTCRRIVSASSARRSRRTGRCATAIAWKSTGRCRPIRRTRAGDARARADSPCVGAPLRRVQLQYLATSCCARLASTAGCRSPPDSAARPLRRPRARRCPDCIDCELPLRRWQFDCLAADPRRPCCCFFCALFLLGLALAEVLLALGRRTSPAALAAQRSRPAPGTGAHGRARHASSPSDAAGRRLVASTAPGRSASIHLYSCAPAGSATRAASEKAVAEQATFMMLS